MDIQDGLRRRAWDSRYYDLPASAKAVPTMLTEEEGKMLCWLGEHYYQGEGDIVELGCFLGGSTVRLASGLKRSGRPWSLHSYDRFVIPEVGKRKFLYAKGYPRFDGPNMLPVFEKHIEPYAGHVTPHRGDIEDHPWTGGKIEILFIDAAKTVETHEYILNQFFDKLIAGRSIVVQQDYLFHQTPWLIATMELLRPKFEMVGWTRNYSVLFACNEVPDASDFARARFDALSQSDVEGLIASARDRFAFEWQREMVTAALDAYRNTPDVTRASGFRPPSWVATPRPGE